ncbi:MAG: NAD(P)-dependent oxidoreductase [Nitrospinota bacterium]
MKKRIGFVGLGRMGGPMAKNLVEEGFPVVGFDVSPECLERAVKAGAEAASSLKDLASKADVVYSMLPDSQTVREVYCGEGGVLSTLKKGGVIIDGSTIDPSVSQEVAAIARQKGVEMLDAPVSGSVMHAEGRQLIIMVGGEKKVMEDNMDIFQSVGSSVFHMGPNGHGLYMKLVTNHMFAIMMSGMAEGLAMGRKAGLDPQYMVDILKRGAVPKILEYKGGPMVQKNYVSTFPVDMMRKDLRLITAMGEELKTPLPMANLARQIFISASAAGFGDKDQGAIIEVYEKLQGL